MPAYKATRRLLTAVLLICTLVTTARAETALATIQDLNGEALIERKNSSFEAKKAADLFKNDRITTKPQSDLSMALNDGSRLHLAESSTLVIDESLVKGDRRTASKFRLLGGSVRALVAAVPSVGTTFEVRTPNAIIGVRGTEFETAYIAGKPCPGFPDCLRYTDVRVFNGTVTVSNPSGAAVEPIEVGAGYETTVACENSPASPDPLGLEDLMQKGYR
jgi:ferric-dicitrate binding protein FerR (iron transport regulator)